MGKHRYRHGKRQRLAARRRREAAEQAEAVSAAQEAGIPTTELVLNHTESTQELTSDLVVIKRLLERQDWAIPEVAYENLPRKLYLIANNKIVNGIGQLEPGDYSPFIQLKAAHLLAMFDRENRQRIVQAARLQQIHDGRMQDQNITVNAERVVVYIPHNNRDQISQQPQVTHEK